MGKISRLSIRKKIFVSAFFDLLSRIHILFFMTLAPACAVTPMDYYNSLVAGGDYAGYLDGHFSAARFSDPSGLAFDDTGTQLYVADSGNHRIRVVHLDRNNDVETVAGSDSIGSLDGPVSTAIFNTPQKLVFLPGNRLAVFDVGTASIRLLDFSKQIVTTLARGVTVRDLIYYPQEDSLYFSQPADKKLSKLNMKSGAVSTVFSNNPLVPSPAALGLWEDHPCVADSDSPGVFLILPDSQSTTTTAGTSLQNIGNVKDVLALTASEGVLYALQKGGFFVRVGSSNSTVIQFPTPWGFLFKNGDHKGYIPFLNIPSENTVGFCASPTEPRKFFIATEHSILSVKDYDFERFWSAFVDNGNGMTDFDYPARKPAKTFRILTVGSSRNSTSFPVPAEPDAPILEDAQDGDSKARTFPKELEFQLNLEASLRDSDIHFEVLNMAHRGEGISSFSSYDVPGVVKRYDIDLVLALPDASGYTDYYLKPMTPEGVPARSILPGAPQKPLSQRAPKGPASDLLEQCKKLKIPVSEKQDYPGDGWYSLFRVKDAQVQNDLREMCGKRLELLNEELNLMKTSSGATPKLVLFFIPCREFPDSYESFWKDLCVQYRLQLLDLSEPYNCLKVSYYPACGMHLSVYGNDLVARLLDHYLKENKLIPF